MEEIKENYLAIVQTELQEFGIQESQITLNIRGSIEVEEHAVDMEKFLEKFPWTKPEFLLRVYTLDSGTLIFMPISREHITEIREKDDLYEELSGYSKVADEVLQGLTKDYMASLRELNDEKTLQQRVPSLIMENLQITENLADVSSWKARVILGNSVGRDCPKLGEWDQVIYVHVGINTGTIVPIAKGDEHNRGYDLVHYLTGKGLIPHDSYHPISYSGDYVDGNDPLALECFKIWRKLGGPNVVIKNSSRGYNNPGVFQVTIDDYINADGLIKMEKGTLFPIGKGLIDHLKKLAELCQEYRRSQRGEKQVYAQALRLLMFYTQKVEQFETKSLQEIKARVMEAEKLGSMEGLQKLEEAIFGFDGLKNQLHQQLRKAMEPNAFSFYVDGMVALFGDMDLANHELGSI